MFRYEWLWKWFPLQQVCSAAKFPRVLPSTQMTIWPSICILSGDDFSSSMWVRHPQSAFQVFGQHLAWTGSYCRLGTGSLAMQRLDLRPILLIHGLRPKWTWMLGAVQLLFCYFIKNYLKTLFLLYGRDISVPWWLKRGTKLPRLEPRNWVMTTRIS